MATPPNVSPHDEPWKLPVGYDSMSPNEQKQVMQSCILKYLQAKGRATAAFVRIGIGASPGQEATVRRNLQLLASTQHIYSDNLSREPIYASNGKLAHTNLQAFIRAGPREYVVRTFNDAYTGQVLTITEYAVRPGGPSKPTGGLRIDLADLDAVLEKLNGIRDALARDRSLLEGNLRR